MDFRPERVETYFTEIFRLDLRSVAVFRISLALILLLDLVLRAKNLSAHYTSSGVLPPGVLRSIGWAGGPSLHTALSSLAGQAFLFLFAGLLAFSLLIGYQARLSAFLSWLLLFSLHNRNPFLLNGGDIFLRMLLLLAVFLPLGKKWAVDSIHGGKINSVISAGTVAISVQIVSIYFFNFFFKLRGDTWTSGTGVYYALGLERYATPLGKVLFHTPSLLPLMDYTVMAAWALSPLLILATGIYRIPLLALFLGIQTGMLLTMHLGLFPLVNIAALTLLLPTFFWEYLETHIHDTGPLPAKFRNITEVLPRMNASRDSLTLDRWMDTGAAVLLGIILLSNLHSIGMTTVPEPAQNIVEETGMEQSWSMFAPDPPEESEWFVVPGYLDNGTRVNVFTGRPLLWEDPERVFSYHRDKRWQKYLSGLHSEEKLRPAFAFYLCNSWNDAHTTKVRNVSVYIVKEKNLPGYRTSHLGREKLLEESCYPVQRPDSR